MNEPQFELATSEQPAPLGERLLVFLLMLLTLGADQASKFWIESNLPLFDLYRPLPAIGSLFRFYHVPNYGTAFGLFQSSGMIFAGTAVLVAIGIVIYNFTLPAGSWLLRVALGLQLGGALGNFADRLRLGYVTDFLAVGPLPIFNLADVAIVTGVGILGVLMLYDSWNEGS